jgi:hypothetical protein
MENQKPKRKKAESKIVNIQAVQEPLWFPIDWDTVNTLEDIKVLIKNMGLGCSNQAPNYNELKKYLSDKPALKN